MPKINYIPVGDYLLPAITLRDSPDAEPLTIYVMMRKRYLKEHRAITYGRLLLREELYSHCRAAQYAAGDRCGYCWVDRGYLCKVWRFFDVTLIEQHKIAGGMCTNWKRKGYLFEGAMH